MTSLNILKLLKKSIQIAMILTILVNTSCSDKPKVIEADVSSDQENPFKQVELPEGHQITFDNQKSAEAKSIFHKVVIQEVLPTSKYVYLKVTEGAEEYWLATKKMDVEVGAIYYYKNGLLKTNFESKEYKKTFKKLFLVSSIVPESHGNETSEKRDIEMHAFEGSKQTSDEASDQLSIAELVNQKDQLAGKTVTLKGTCTKVNAKIMGRNWIHLKDGSMDDYDLVITSSSEVPVGHEIEISAIVTLGKDFGSGYYYDLILENGVVSSL